MRISKHVSIRYVPALVTLMAALIFNACNPTSVPIEPFLPSPSPALTPTQPTEEPTEDLPRSSYYDQVTLLESANLPLTRGDEVYVIRSSVMHDINDDGVSDAIFTMATYPENIAHPLVILNGDGSVENSASDVFRGGYIPLLFYFQTLIAGIVMIL